MDFNEIISNVKIYGLYESMVASGYPMLINPYTPKDFCEQIDGIDNVDLIGETTTENNNTKRGIESEEKNNNKKKKKKKTKNKKKKKIKN